MRKIILSSIFYLSIFFYLFSPNFLIAETVTGTETITVSATVAGVTVTPSTDTNSGSGISLPRTSIRFSGEAYSLATITVLKNGQIVTTIKADKSGLFSVTLEEKYNSNVLYSLFAEDTGGNRSLLINYPIAVQVGFLTHLSGIRFAPTIITDKLEVRAGDYLTVDGYAFPNKEMEIVIEGVEKRIFTLTSSKEGFYKIMLPLSDFPKGEYSVFTRYIDDIRISKLVKFIIGELNIFNSETLSSIPGDCNVDKIINLVDFSILAFWYSKDNPPKCVDTNKDLIINLIDFSILAFYWTG